MIGILVQLALSWLLVWLFEKENLGFLGIQPLEKNLKGASFFFLLTASCCMSGFLLRMYFGKEEWSINPAFNFKLLVNGTWWQLRSVIYEELIFRGVLLYILMRKFGATIAIVISSVAFGIYHWFSQEVFGNPAQMAVTFMTTGLMGVVLAYAYVKTRSILIPIAIHFGWNLTQGFIFSSGSVGDGVFVLTKQPEMQVSWFVFLLVFYLPICSAMLLNLVILRKWR